MTKDDDVVVGCITNYDFAAIAPWVNSLDRCGFTGKKIMICYNIKADVVQKLLDRNYIVLGFTQEENGDFSYKKGQPFSIVVDRFFHIWALLKQYKGQYRYMVHTDVKDVIFQRDPSIYLEENLNGGRSRLLAASESLQYQHEDWGKENLKASFGEVIYEAYKDKGIVNAGTLSGYFDYLLDFFLQVYMVSAGGRTHNPDQAAVNILLKSKPYIDVTMVHSNYDAWACQAGTTDDPNKREKYKQFFESPHDSKNYLDIDDGFIKNSKNLPFYMVHQYDRVPEWREALLKKYGE